MITVVCTGGEEPPLPLCRRWLDTSDRVIAADGGLALLKRLERRADLWVGDGDSLGPLEPWTSWFQRSLVLDRNKDDTDTEVAVREAVTTGSEVWLLGGSGQRMDHWLANLRLVENQTAITRWLTASEQAWALEPGAPFFLDPGTVSVFPLGKGPWSLRSHGLQWALDQVDFSRWHSLSNQAEAGASLSVEAGRFLVLRPFLEESSP